MQETVKTKKVGDIFYDYQTKANIQYANIQGLNVIKKTNTLEILLYFDEYIEIKEIWFFEKFLIERIGLQKEEVMTIGDNINDKKMIENAGMGIAMKGSTIEILKVAKDITETNDDDGVAIALEKYAL